MCAADGRLLLLLLHLAAAQDATVPETYAEYVNRSLSQPGASLEAALAAQGHAALQFDEIEPLVLANVALLDAPFSDGDVTNPSSDARIAVPLLLQYVREWTAHGQAQRDQAFLPVVDALSGALADVDAPRVLVPGSGLGRLVYDIAEALKGSSMVVAVEPDVHAQLTVRWLIDPEPERGQSDNCDDADDGTLTYPALHLDTGWADASDRLAAVISPDVSRRRRRELQERADVQLVVGSFPEAVARPEPSADEAFAHAFDGAATSFFLDVVPDLLGAVRSLHGLLAPRGGIWANLGPLAYPDAPGEALGGSNAAFALSGTQLLALVRGAGFEVLEERWVACEYGGLPRRLERGTERTCLFFVARAR